MMKAWWCLTVVLAAAPGEAPSEPPASPAGEELSGGATTVFDTTLNAFGRALGNMEPGRWKTLRDGKALFVRDWSAPPEALAGPLTNAQACNSCHFKDGRDRPYDAIGPEAPLLIRLSVPTADAPGGAPEPVYGGQFNDRGTPGIPAEGTVQVKYVPVKGRYADATAYTLRRPHYKFSPLGYGPFAPKTQWSPRIPATVVGLGLLEAIPEADLLARADPEDTDGDGISGRPNRVTSTRTGQTVLGRFGWKASQPTLEQQIAKAYSEDLGVTSPLYSEPNCTPKQEACRAVTQAREPVLSAEMLEKTTLYIRLLAVPARRDWNAPAVRRGQAVFQQTGCASCHHPEYRTGEVADIPELSGQTIRPYTDLLLHDMGKELADGRPDAEATGSEWRTPPLWGLGLLETVNHQLRLLHDGRARSFEEAILWHGGEAEAARERFKRLERADRDALVAFIRSL
ncbi:di-heme oxidoreductase family protein [Archangium lansingense]|uniref:C-type cytochrome n=1 Tax=Archangium lansingense TaxID=2995310 RepID=A0ABT4A920_9BACT|nr:di-heme oxidoredictase family protein [Archangium lansinium]MCY1078150.1 c-type cytochrome [Archangium lansinium]